LADQGNPTRNHIVRSHRRHKPSDPAARRPTRTDAGVDLHILQRVAGHQDPAVTARYLHPDVRAMLEAGTAFSAWWSVAGPERPSLGVIDGGKNVG
jgi:hypothetical protein